MFTVSKHMWKRAVSGLALMWPQTGRSKLVALLTLAFIGTLALAGAKAQQPPQPTHQPAAGAASEAQPPVVKKGTAGKLRGAIKLLPASGAGSVELQPEGDAFKGRFFIENVGQGPLVVTRVVARTSPDKPRLPAGFGVQADKVPLTIAPGQKSEVNLSWTTQGTQGEPISRAKELYGHVLVESDALAPDGTPGKQVAIGVHAEKSTGLPIIGNHLLSFMVFLPMLGLLAIFIAHLMGYKKDENLRWLTLVLMGVNLLLAAWLYRNFDPSFLQADGNDGYQFIERVVWIRSLNAEYFIGIDSISVTMILLTALISFVGVIVSWSVAKQLKGYFAMYNLLVVGMMGTFVALDLILFFVFWELMLLPMYFLIGNWGGPKRLYAAIKFFVYTLGGSVFMLLGFVFFYLNADPTYMVDGQSIVRSLSVPDLARVAWESKGLLILGLSATKVIWVWMFVAFAIKIPMFPFHTWLPDAHVEAPTAISVILAGVLLKMGTYGILRFNFMLLPEATRWASTAMAVFGVIGILSGGFCAMAQKDLKKLVAYSSVSHMGFCLLAMGSLTSQGIEACIVQMFNHGLITAMLFTLVGVVYDRVHTRDLDKFGGLATEMPLYSAFFGFAFMASLGLPGLSGFWGEAMTFIGAFQTHRVLTILAATGVIVTAAYHLWAMQRMFLGKFRESWRKNKYLAEFDGKFPEINRREIASLAPLAFLILLLGFWPRPLLNLIDMGALQMHRLVHGGAEPMLTQAPLPAAEKVAVVDIDVPAKH
jgi:NADH-quinone oxidoreductase subunit M